jgi:hypothetical protein
MPSAHHSVVAKARRYRAEPERVDIIAGEPLVAIVHGVHATFMCLHQPIQAVRVRSPQSIVDVPPPGVAGPDLGTRCRRERVVCATCELEVPWTPVRYGNDTYCCHGCAAGGPCSCSYDDAG